MDHTAKIVRRGVDLTVLAVIRLMVSVTLAVIEDGKETYVNKVSFLIIEIVHHNLIFDFKLITFRSHILIFLHLKVIFVLKLITLIYKILFNS